MIRVARSWSVYDFLLIWLGGFAGSAIFLVLAVAIGDEDLLVALSLAGQFVGYLGVFWILTRYKPVGALGLIVKMSDVLYTGAGLVVQLGLAYLFLPLSNALFPDERPVQESIELITEADTTLVKVALVTLAVVIAPATEEIMYRGVLLKALESRGKLFALIVSSVVFSAVHLTGLDPAFLWRSAVVTLPPLFLLGLILAWLTQRTGRLGPAIFLHSGWNLLTAFVLLVPTELLEQAG